jgi:anti-anti-sigma regulatory factor
LDAHRRELERRVALDDPHAFRALEQEWVRSGRGWEGEELPPGVTVASERGRYLALDGLVFLRAPSGLYVREGDPLARVRLARLGRSGRPAGVVEAIRGYTRGKPPAPFRENEAEALVSADSCRIVIDMEPCPTVSDVSLSGLMRWDERLRGLGGKLVLARPNSQIRMIFQMLGLDRLDDAFPPVAPSIESALDLLDG